MSSSEKLNQKLVSVMVGSTLPPAEDIWKDEALCASLVDELYGLTKAKKAIESREKALKAIFSAHFEATGRDEYMGKKGKVVVTPKTATTISPKAFYVLLYSTNRDALFWDAVSVGIGKASEILTPKEIKTIATKEKATPAVSAK